MPDRLVLFFAQNPLLLVFAVVALGYPISKLRVAGASLGVSSILFAGVALGALIVVPELDGATRQHLSLEMKLVYELGLAIFVYAMGLGIAHSFWAAFSREGIRKNATVLIVLGISAFVVAGLARLLTATGLFACNGRFAAGLYAGAFTNMPALAGVIEALRRQGADALAIAQPIVANAIAYPIGVMVPMMSIVLSRRWFKVDLQEEAKGLLHEHAGAGRLVAATLEVTEAGEGMTHVDLRDRANCKVVFSPPPARWRDPHRAPGPGAAPRRPPPGGGVVRGRGPRGPGPGPGIGRGPPVRPPRIRLCPRLRLQLRGDRPSPAGAAAARKAQRHPHPPPARRPVVRAGRGHGAGAGRPGCGWSRPRDNLRAMEEFFGDSYRELSEASFLTFAMGLAAGLALGQVPIPLGHGIIFRLGFAGGPLLAGLILGRYHRIGPFVWNIPYSANHTIRQFGLVLFAAGIGIISGEGFRFIIASNFAVLPVFIGAALVVCLAADLMACFIGYRLFRIPLNVLYGILAGMYTQPVVLGYANQQTRNELPNVGFATVYPLATVLKIVLAQVLLVLAA